MRFSPKVVKMTWLGIGKTASLEFRTEKKIFEKNIGGAPEAPPLGSTGLKVVHHEDVDLETGSSIIGVSEHAQL